jgi:hypothetical protein
MITKSDLERIGALLEREEQEQKHALMLLYGELPSWFPVPRREHAERIIGQLLNDNFSPEEIAAFVENEFTDKRFVPGTVKDSRAFLHAVNELAHIKYALSNSKSIEESLEMLAGSQAVTGSQFRAGGKTKRGKEYEPTASVRKICGFIKTTNFDDVLEALSDAERCLDWYESTKEPIGILFTAVDTDEATENAKRKIYYLPRGANADAQKSLTFASLRNILTKIKKST